MESQQGQKSAVRWTFGTTLLTPNSATSSWNPWTGTSSWWTLPFFSQANSMTKTSWWVMTLRFFLCLKTFLWDIQIRWVYLVKLSNPHLILFPECIKDARGDVSRSERLQSYNCRIHVQADKEIQQVHLHLLHSCAKDPLWIHPVRACQSSKSQIVRTYFC